MPKLILYGFFLALCIMGGGCTDNAVVDTNFEINNRNWSYVNKIKVPVKIDDPGRSYSVFLNLRHTAEYRYSNIFVLAHFSGPGIPRTTERREFMLAYPDGEWLGSGSGNIYSYRLPLKANYRFPAKGIYTVEIEQNMRDNPLREISDAGVRVEPEK